MEEKQNLSEGSVNEEPNQNTTGVILPAYNRFDFTEKITNIRMHKGNYLVKYGDVLKVYSPDEIIEVILEYHQQLHSALKYVELAAKRSVNNQKTK